jgi:hypothetical protein
MVGAFRGSGSGCRKLAGRGRLSFTTLSAKGRRIVQGFFSAGPISASAAGVVCARAAVC